jgi:TolB-like protein
VLPFADLSPGQRSRVLRGRPDEELLNAWRASRTCACRPDSCFAFKDKDVDVAAVAARLRVTIVLEGSVRRSGDASASRPSWSKRAAIHSLVRNLRSAVDDIFAIQGDIARHIVSALQLRLRPQDAADATTLDARAYEFYLKGLSFYRRFGPKSLRFAIDMFGRATSLTRGLQRPGRAFRPRTRRWLSTTRVERRI